MRYSLAPYDQHAIMTLMGIQDSNFYFLQEQIHSQMVYHGHDIEYEPLENIDIEHVLDELFCMIAYQNTLTQQDIQYCIQQIQEDPHFHYEQYTKQIVGTTIAGKTIIPKTRGQQQLIHLFNTKTITFAIGPAGSGKTFLSVVHAVNALKKNQVKRIVLTRPAVEAGESLGFLPGDLKEKVDPYLRPLYDALQLMLGQEAMEKMMEKGIIEVAPLAYMRGRTLDEAYIILDEAQNTTKMQMKMFLTRLGNGSKMVITGDQTQIDLPYKQESGLIHASHILKGIEEVGIHYLHGHDIVRHPVVMKVIACYEKGEADGN